MMPVPLRFAFDLFRREVASMSRLAHPFMDPVAEGVFSELLMKLDLIRMAGRPSRWGASVGSPLVTRPSSDYEPGGKTAFAVRGEISWTWEVTPLRLRAKAKAPPDAFDVNGIASAKIQIRKTTEDKAVVLTTWKVELGAVDSPGCYFHSHIAGDLSIPRIPSLFVTPMAALEFLLGELFQDRWAEHVSSDSDEVQFWRSTQVKSFVQMLEWKKKKIESGVGSPWIALREPSPKLPMACLLR